jgi:hypothetical protein
MRKNSYKRILSVAAFVALFLIFAPRGVVTAQTTGQYYGPSPTTPISGASTNTTAPAESTAQQSTSKAPTDALDCGSDLATCVVYFVSYLINKLIAVFISLGATFLAGMLALNETVYSSPAVQTGFSIVLSFANLGFVLAIIVIAIATILQSQTYGVKKLLWKLVVMAILVNFGLVATRPIFSFSDSISNYFVAQIGGNASGLATNVTNAFSPQEFSGGYVGGTPTVGQVVGGVGAGIAGALTVCGTVTAAASVTLTPIVGGIAGLLCVGGFYLGGAALGGVVQSVAKLVSGGDFNDAFVAMIIGMITSAILLAIAAFSLIALAVMLLIRYLYMTFLLILLPLAWLAWVFPGVSSYFKKWWDLFLRWTFFPAIALFFIYLTFLIVPNATGGKTNPSYLSTSLGTSPSAITSQDLATRQEGLGQQALTDIVLAGMMLGGLFAANKLGIAGADTAIKYAKTGGNWVAGKAGKQTQKGLRAGYGAADEGLRQRSKTGRGITERLQGSRIAPIAALGRGISSVSTNEKMVEDAKKNVPKNPEEIKRNLAGSMNKEMQFAHIAKLVEMGELTGTEDVNGKNIKEFLDSNGDVMKRYGQTKLSGDADKAMGESKEMRDARKKVDAATEAGTDTAAAMQELNNAVRRFVEKLSKADVAKMNVNGMFSDETEDSKQTLASIAKYNPALLPNILAKAKASVGNNMRRMFDKLCKDEEANIGPWQNDEKMKARNIEITKRLEKLKENLETVQTDPKMNDAERIDAQEKIEAEQNKLQDEASKMQDNYVEKKLNEKYHKDTFEKAMANNVFAATSEPSSGSRPGTSDK